MLRRGRFGGILGRGGCQGVLQRNEPLAQTANLHHPPCIVVQMRPVAAPSAKDRHETSTEAAATTNAFRRGKAMQSCQFAFRLLHPSRHCMIKMRDSNRLLNGEAQTPPTSRRVRMASAWRCHRHTAHHDSSTGGDGAGMPLQQKRQRDVGSRRKTR